MSKGGRNLNYNELDPFSEERYTYDSLEIRRTKAKQLKRATSKPSPAPIENKKKKNTTLSKIKSFFEELPNRADRYRIYRTTVIIFASVVAMSLLFVFIIAPWLNEQRKGVETKKAIEYHNEIDNLIDREEVDNSVKEELKNQIENNSDNLEAQSEYILALLNIYKSESDILSIEYEADKFLDSDPSFPTNAYFLMNLSGIYLSLGMNDKYIETIEALLKLPDDEKYDFNAESFTKFKEKTRQNLEIYKQELSE